MTVLEVRGFELRDLFLIGFNDNCGSILVPTRERAEEIRVALEPAYAVEVEELETGDWSAKFDRRSMDGTVPSWLITDITLKDGRKVMEKGRWL
jgi:ribosomal protein L23